MTTNHHKVLVMTKDILIARKQRDLNREVAHYQKLLKFCEDNNIKFNTALEGGIEYNKNSVVGKMQGWGIE